MLAHHRPDLLHPGLNPGLMLYEGPVVKWLLLPCLLGQIQEAPGSPPLQQLKGRKAGGALGYLSDGKEHVQEELGIVHDGLPEHLLQGLVEALNEAIGLGVAPTAAPTTPTAGTVPCLLLSPWQFGGAPSQGMW